MYHNGQRFSTYEADNDNNDVYHCADLYHGGWWYEVLECHACNLNGKYYGEADSSDIHNDGIVWQAWTGGNYPLKACEMKVRPA